MKIERFAPSSYVSSYENFTNDALTVSPFVTSGLQLHLDAGHPSSYPGSGTTWTDISGNARNGTIVSPPSPVFDSQNGGSINFSGSSYVSLPANNFSYGTGSFTVESWVLCTSMVTNNIIFASQSSNSTGFYTTVMNSSSGWVTGFFDGSTRPGTTLRPVPSLNTWYHFVGMRDGTTIRNYLNGFVSYSNGTTSLSVTSGDVRIGQNPATNGERWNGRIAVVRVYNRALSATEVIQNFNNARARFGV